MKKEKGIMKKAFLLLTAFAFLASCKQPTDGDTENTSKISFTIRNQSSYDLSAVTWADASFTASNGGANPRTRGHGLRGAGRVESLEKA
jgi:hypothetical protein